MRGHEGGVGRRKNNRENSSPQSDPEVVVRACLTLKVTFPTFFQYQRFISILPNSSKNKRNLSNSLTHIGHDYNVHRDNRFIKTKYLKEFNVFIYLINPTKMVNGASITYACACGS